MGKCIAIYSRKSKFTGKGESIENQIELCRQYIEKSQGAEEPIEILIYEDEGFSGKNTLRPQLKKMLLDAKKKKFTMLVCYRLDRISRNVGDFANMVEELHKLGIDFVSVREAFDTSNPMGRAMMYIASVFAQLERETIAERIRDNMYELSKTGRWLGGTTPTGYTSESIEKVTVDGRRRKAYALKLIPREAQLITLIYDKFLETGSLTKTDAYLVQNHHTTKNNLNFSRFAIKSILTNPVYMIADEEAYRYITDKKMDLFSNEKEFDGKHGIMAYNRTLQRDGMAHKERNMNEWIISVGKHKGIISGYQWISVQKLLERNKSKAYKKPRSNSALLAGLLVCGDCGSYMRPKLTRRYTQEGDRSFDYLCTMKEKSSSKCCSIPNTKGNILDDSVSKKINTLQKDPDIFLKKLTSLYKTMSEQSKEKEGELDRIEMQYQRNEKSIASLLSALEIASDSSAQQYIVKQIEEYHEKSELLKNQMDEIRNQKVDIEFTDDRRFEVAKELMDFGFCMERAPLEQKRRAVRALVKKAVWDGNDIHLYFYDAKPSGEDSK